MSHPLLKECCETFKEVQDTICKALERCDGGASFSEDIWFRPGETSGMDGGGGITKVIANGDVIEKGGVNFSYVHGTLPEDMSFHLTGKKDALPFHATGTSLVIHPRSPLVPTIHANIRFLYIDNTAWFGGGVDLTPYVLFEEDVIHFHNGLKKICDAHSPDYYPLFKKNCDEYFFIRHRGETRGVGGIFYDYLGKDHPTSLTAYKDFTFALGAGFNDLYIPIVEKRKGLTWTVDQKNFQLLRRGRYVEFNLLYDRGTLFGLKTSGRIESIFMSLPQHASWEYNYTPPPGSPEEKLSEIFKNPRNWVS